MPALGCHCLLIETNAHGLVLVDTGFGMNDIARPTPRLSGLYLRFAGIRFDARDTAIEQVRELGFKAGDVRHLIMTHLDFAHAGGISDFPGATVHVLAEEAAAARHRHGFLGRRRYRPAQWRAAHWHEYATTGETWFGFGAVHRLAGLPPEVLMVPLAGHTRGHCGVAVQADGRWLLHAGDAYFAHGELAGAAPRAPAGVAAYAWIAQVDGQARRRNRARLRELAATRAGEITVFCSHDIGELRERQRASEAWASRAAS